MLYLTFGMICIGSLAVTVHTVLRFRVSRNYFTRNITGLAKTFGMCKDCFSHT